MNKGSLFIKFKTLHTRTKKILRILSEDINERKDHAIVLAWLVYIAFVVIFSKITISTLGFIGNIFTNAIGNIILDSIIGIVITIVISIRWYTKFYKKKYRITTLYLVLSQFYILVWIFIRFKMLGYGDLIAIPIFSSTCPITFLDLGFLPCLLLNVLYLDILISTKQDNTDATSSNDEITDDYPKEKIAQDHASRKAIVNDIFEKLSKADVSKHSYSVAIIGQWGIGKTTVLNFILEKNKEKAVFHVIKFSPWNFSCQANLINEFFQQLSTHIGEYDSSIPTLISKYASLLIGTEHDGLSSLINDTFSSKTDVAKLFETIGKRLKSIPHKFLIVTDDMDRLDGHEIIEVFRLIRGSASFPNLLFLSAFDKGYVVDTLKNLSPSYNYRFIEKFFQAEYYISAPDVLSIEKTLKAETKLFLTEEDYCAFIEYLDQKYLFSSHRPLELFIITFRDLYRWLNALKISYNRLKGDVLIADLCDIVLLKLFFPQIYAIFSVQPQLYLLSHENKVELWSEEKSKKIAEENKHDYLFSILKGGDHKTDIRQTQEFKGLNEYDQNKILDIFERLLKKYDIPDKSFVLDFYTNRYFTNELTELEMSIEEFHDLICKEPKVI